MYILCILYIEYISYIIYILNYTYYVCYIYINLSYNLSYNDNDNYITANKSGAKFGRNRCFVTLFANPYLRRIYGQVTG